jgi:hypothetical protein
MLDVRPADQVVVCVNGVICGLALVEAVCKEVAVGPPESGVWSYAKSFFRIALVDYTVFSSPVGLKVVAERFKHEIRQEMLSLRPTYYLYSWYPESEFYPGGKLVLGQGRFLARAAPVLSESVTQCFAGRDRQVISLSSKMA